MTEAAAIATPAASAVDARPARARARPSGPPGPRVPPSRRIVASSSRRSAVAIAAVLTSASAANSTDSPIDHPHAPRAARAERAHVVEVLGAGLRPARRDGPRRSGRASAPPRPPATKTALVGRRAGVLPGERRVEHDVAEARARGRRSRRRAASTARRVLQAGADGVADLEVALGRDDAADGDGGAASRRAWPPARTPQVERRGVPRRARRPATGRPSPSGPCRAGTPASGSTPVAASTPGSRASCAAVPAGSGAPSRPATTWPAVTRAAVTDSVSWRAARRAARPGCRPASRSARSASPARRCASGWPPGRCSRAGRARRAAAAAATAAAAGRPSSQRPSSAVPGREQDRREDRERVAPARRRRCSAIAAPPPSDEHAGEHAHDAGTAVLDRHLAQRLGRAHAPGAPRRGDDRELGDADAHAERRGERDPGVARLEAGRHDAVVGEHARRSRGRAARRRAGRARSRPRERISASAAISRRTWRGVAPSARSTAVSRRRWAIASANVPATTNSATAPAIPPIAPKIATSVARSDAVGSPASAFAAWSRSSTSTAGPCAARSRARSASAETPRSATTPIALTRPGAPDCAARDRGGEEQRGLAAVPARRPGGEAADAVGRLAARRDDPQRRRRRARRGGRRRRRRAGRPGARPAVSRYGVSAALGQPWPCTRSTPAPCSARPSRVAGAGRERDVADGARDARDLRGALDRRGGRAAAPGTTSTASRRRRGRW